MVKATCPRVRLVSVAIFLALTAADWRQFRGPDSSSVSPETAPPRPLSPGKDVIKKVDLPGRGLSGPIVVGDRVFLTACSGYRQDQLHVLAFHARSGSKLWERSFWATGPTTAHPKTCMAAPTPVSDGRHLVALFGTNDLACLDLDGNVLWLRALHEENPGATDGRGLATSPLIVRNTVILQIENQNTSFAAGIDLRTGANRWRVERPREVNWTTPIELPAETPGQTLVLLQSLKSLAALDPASGKEVWKLERGSDPIASSVVHDGVLLVPAEKGLAAYALQPSGAPPKLLWEEPRLGPQTASPVALGGRVYSLRGAILVTGDLKTGEVKGQLRLKGPFSSTPVALGNVLYCFSEDGVAQVVIPNDGDGQVVDSAELGETILSTPAISGGAIYVRSDQHLWILGKS